MLGIPLPDWAQRKPSGPKPGQAIMAAYRAENPETLYDATMRKSKESASKVLSKAPAFIDPLSTAPIDTSFLG